MVFLLQTVKWVRGRQARGRQTVSVNSGRPKRGRQTRGRQTVDVNSVVQEGSSNSGREQCRPIGVVKQGVVKQWT